MNEENNKNLNNYVEILKTNNYGLINYYLYKIHCDLKTNSYILGIKLIYKHKNDNSKINAINIPPKKKSSLEQEYTFEPSEYISSIKLWLDDRLLGFEIMTDKGKIQKFGYGENEHLVIIPDFENKDKVIVGFEIGADDKDGITSMCCYYLNKNRYTALMNTGPIYLKIKLRDLNYRKKIEKKIKNFDEKYKLLFKVCLLPDHPFYEVMKYMIN